MRFEMRSARTRPHGEETAMSNPAFSDCHVKVFYYLIEAAILWAGKADQAQQILKLTVNLDGTQIIAKLKQLPLLEARAMLKSGV